MANTSYAIALGSNMRSRFGSPAETLCAAAERLEPIALSRIRSTSALGPAGRSFANAAAILSNEADPPQLLTRLKALEREFGRRSGRHWGARVLDLDIILWSEGAWAGPRLVVPHPEFRARSFVLDPLAELVPDWRDPVTGLTVRQIRARARAATPVDRTGGRT